MAIKTLLIPLDGRTSDLNVLEYALALAKRCGAHLQALHVRAAAPDTAPFMFDRLTAKLKQTVIQELESDAKEKTVQVQTMFDEFCARNKVPIVTKPAAKEFVSAAWHEDVGRISEVLVRRGRLADLIVLARPLVSPSTIRRSPVGESLEAVLLETGRPVLAVPPEYPPNPIKRVAIGWNASMEVSRAVALALPFLASAEAVTILTSAEWAQSARALAEYLAWHGVAAEQHSLELKHRSAGEALLADAKTIGADLLVIGGFSHTRARELLFGGTTRHLLAAADLPVFMVH